MNRELKIKVCGMRSLDNIARVGELPIDYMGFIFWKGSPRYAGEELDSRKIKSVLPARIKRVGVFVDASDDEIEQVYERCRLDVVQLHGGESAEYCALLRRRETVVVKAFAVDGKFDFSHLVPYEGNVDYFLFDTRGTSPGGTGERFDWYRLEEYKGRTPFFLSGGISPSDAREIKSIAHPGLYGVDLNSRFEISPGWKDEQRIKDFIEDLKVII